MTFKDIVNSTKEWMPQIAMSATGFIMLGLIGNKLAPENAKFIMTSIGGFMGAVLLPVLGTGLAIAGLSGDE